MHPFFVMLYVIYLFYYVDPQKQLKKQIQSEKLIQCEKNSEQLEAEIQDLKNKIKTIIIMSKNET
jgi:hypothetical protein